MMQSTKVAKFGESKKGQWYETAKGERIKCNEDDIANLWQIWVVQKGVERYMEGEDVVFEFPPNKPLYIETN